MTKVKKQGTQGAQGAQGAQGTQGAEKKAGVPKTSEAKKTGSATPEPPVAPKDSAAAIKGKPGAKSDQPRVGGTAVQGAKSTRPKEITATNSQQQQAESYNRDMRRRMEHMGTGPSQTSGAKDPRQKRLEKKKKRVEERKQEVKKVAATGPRKIALGRRNTYFVISVVAIIVLVIIVAFLINHFR